MSQIQCWLGFVFVVVWGAIFLLKTYLDDKMEAKIKSEKVTACNFTLMFKNFPKKYLDKPYEQAFTELQNIFVAYGTSF